MIARTDFAGFQWMNELANEWRRKQRKNVCIFNFRRQFLIDLQIVGFQSVNVSAAHLLNNICNPRCIKMESKLFSQRTSAPHPSNGVIAFSFFLKLLLITRQFRGPNFYALQRHWNQAPSRLLASLILAPPQQLTSHPMAVYLCQGSCFHQYQLFSWQEYSDGLRCSCLCLWTGVWGNGSVAKTARCPFRGLGFGSNTSIGCLPITCNS